MIEHQDYATALADTFRDHPPRTVLRVGPGTARVLDPFVLEASRRNGGSCAVFRVGSPSQGGGSNVHVVAEPVVRSDELPALSETATAVNGTHVGAQIASLTEARRGSRADWCALDTIAADFGLRSFDVVEIAGEDVATAAIVNRVKGSAAIWLDGCRSTVAGRQAYQALFADPTYRLAASNSADGSGSALFVLRDATKSPLAIHFFTIVLNGEPFIRYHEQMLTELSCPWHWHIVEGVAELVKDTAWSVSTGGRIPDELHDQGRSVDGTSDYLDDLKRRLPHHVSIYRKPPGTFWSGKLEMVSAPLENIHHPCLLWQIDSDELWRADQIEAVRRMFVAEPDRTGAFFWCKYYVGPEKGIATRYNYAENPSFEWLRVWNFRPGMVWDRHEPPVLAERNPDTGEMVDVGKAHPFRHHETEAAGAVFDHFAYVTEAQAAFKESYYGYGGAVEQWRKLQRSEAVTGHLRDYFAWVSDETMFAGVDDLGWRPLARVDPITNDWHFANGTEIARESKQGNEKPMKVLIDGVFFQLLKGGIGRVWTHLLEAWLRSGFARHVVVLDRGGTAPRMDGIVYRTIEPHSWAVLGDDAAYLERICAEENASLFVSTYYTTPLATPTVFMGHDMIPEVMGMDLDDLWWQQKRRAIQYASGHVMVSQNSIDDMLRFFPHLDRRNILLAYNAIDPIFRPCAPGEVEAFRRAHDIDRPYVLMVGERKGWKGYKNGIVVFAAIAELPEAERPIVVCVGGNREMESEFRDLLLPSHVRHLSLDDDELRLAYGAAEAFVCPSFYEGFGLPIGEAMASGCPVLTCRNSSLYEVGGDAALYFDPKDPASLLIRWRELRSEGTRARMVSAGFEQIKKFDVDRSAAAVADLYLTVVTKVGSGEIANSTHALSDLFGILRREQVLAAKMKQLEGKLFETKTALASQFAGSGQPWPSDGDSSARVLDAALAVERRLGEMIDRARCPNGASGA